MVVVDNASGIREAVRHLVGHGHRRIAFVAGKQHRGGDSAERLEAYLRGLSEEGLEPDDRLVAYGEHRYRRRPGGDAQPSRRSSGLHGIHREQRPVMSRRDRNAARMRALRSRGRRGDRLRRHPRRSVQPAIADHRPTPDVRARVRERPRPPRPDRWQSDLLAGGRADAPDRPPVLRLRARTTVGHSRTRAAGPISGQTSRARSSRHWRGRWPRRHSARLATARSISSRSSARGSSPHWPRASAQRDERPLRDEVARLLARSEERGEDPHVWQSAVSALYRGSTSGSRPGGNGPPALADRAPRPRSARDQRAGPAPDDPCPARAHGHDDRARASHGATALRAGGWPRARRSSPSTSRGWGSTGSSWRPTSTTTRIRAPPPRCSCRPALSGDGGGRRFPSREFPPRGLYPDDEPLQLILLPLRVDERTTGFVALSTTNLEPPAAIVSNLATAIRGGRLYREAVDGRRLAEEANQLKGRFLSMVSHELRTPLSVVVGLSDMVVREARQSGSSSLGHRPRPRADGRQRRAPRPADRRRARPREQRGRPAPARPPAPRPLRGPRGDGARRGADGPREGPRVARLAAGATACG